MLKCYSMAVWIKDSLKHSISTSTETRSCFTYTRLFLLANTITNIISSATIKTTFLKKILLKQDYIILVQIYRKFTMYEALVIKGAVCNFSCLSGNLALLLNPISSVECTYAL